MPPFRYYVMRLSTERGCDSEHHILWNKNNKPGGSTAVFLISDRMNVAARMSVILICQSSEHVTDGPVSAAELPFALLSGSRFLVHASKSEMHSCSDKTYCFRHLQAEREQ
ncbi:hypothetical protein EVAR_75975_1 [Eumeta japonica]|uniref:Uncharacterized protein n=1 Tax=Eumeta variegata TaxID=151549 RepID=A0A4C1UA52_EUMVA|nr:hypothetical protein EVAR_75975_1 [Eumeta japonica]